MIPKRMAGACVASIAVAMLVAGTVASFAQSSSAVPGAQAQTAPPSKAANANAAQSGAKCCGPNTSSKPPVSAARPADPNVVACHALEVHTNAQPAVTVLVFNQKNRDDHERLSDLLKDNEGVSVEVKASDGTWHKASVARLRSCFGRGLLFFSGDASPVEEKDDFLLRFPAKKTS